MLWKMLRGVETVAFKIKRKLFLKQYGDKYNFKIVRQVDENENS